MQQSESIETYIQAIELCDAALRFAANDLETLKRKGRASEKLYEIQLKEQQYSDAIETLKQAIAV